MISKVFCRIARNLVQGPISIFLFASVSKLSLENEFYTHANVVHFGFPSLYSFKQNIFLVSLDLLSMQLFMHTEALFMQVINKF